MLSGNLISDNFLRKFYPLQKVSVFYHAVSDEPLPFTSSLYRVISTRQFEKDLDYLLRLFNDKLELSFDDGLRQCHEVIAPVLLRKGVQATFFLNSSFINNNDLFYRYKAALLINAAEKDQSFREHLLTSLRVNNYKKFFLGISYKNRNQLDLLAQEAGLSFAEFLSTQKPYLETEQIRKLISQGFLIGAHSMDHPPYYELSLKQQIEQTRQSMDKIASDFDLSYRHFSFPFTDWGVSEAFFKTVFNEGIVDKTWACAGMKKDEEALNTQRIAMDETGAPAEQVLKNAILKYALKMPLGRNLIKRS